MEKLSWDPGTGKANSLWSTILLPCLRPVSSNFLTCYRIFVLLVLVSVLQPPNTSWLPWLPSADPSPGPFIHICERANLKDPTSSTVVLHWTHPCNGAGRIHNMAPHPRTGAGQGAIVMLVTMGKKRICWKSYQGHLENRKHSALPPMYMKFGNSD